MRLDGPAISTASTTSRSRSFKRVCDVLANALFGLSDTYCCPRKVAMALGAISITGAVTFHPPLRWGQKRTDLMPVLYGSDAVARRNHRVSKPVVRNAY